MSLTFAPITAARAAMQMHVDMATEDAVTEHHGMQSGAEITDCMKAMQGVNGEKGSSDKNCPCCDTPAKGTCPDIAGCLAKCSINVALILLPSSSNAPERQHYGGPPEPQKLPDWSFKPPAPPPKA